jgi:hypothetical protein
VDLGDHALVGGVDDIEGLAFLALDELVVDEPGWAVSEDVQQLRPPNGGFWWRFFDFWSFTYRPVGCSYLPEVGVSSWTEVILKWFLLLSGRCYKQEAMAQQSVSYDGKREGNIVMPRGGAGLSRRKGTSKRNAPRCHGPPGMPVGGSDGGWLAALSTSVCSSTPLAGAWSRGLRRVG